MPSITIRNLDQRTKERLRNMAAKHRRSMEEEARQILRAALTGMQTAPQDLARSIADNFSKLVGVELKLPAREAMREPPGFGK